MDKLKVCLLSNTATLPTRKHSTDAGIDLYADLFTKSTKNMESMDYLVVGIEPNSVAIVGTGVCVEIPVGCFGYITNKSGSDFLIGGGIVDEGYQGELLVKIFNPTSKIIGIEHGQKIAQLIFIPCLTLEVLQVSDKEIYSNSKSERGSTGGIVEQVDWHHEKDFPDRSEYLKWRSEQGGMFDDDIDEDEWDDDDDFDYLGDWYTADDYLDRYGR